MSVLISVVILNEDKINLTKNDQPIRKAGFKFEVIN